MTDTLVSVTDISQTSEAADLGFDDWLQSIKERFKAKYVTPLMLIPLFEVNIHDCSSFYDQVFLYSMPAEVRQYLNCGACRDFVNKYGTLVEIDPETGKLESAVWSMEGVPPFYATAVENMRLVLTNSSRIKGIFHDQNRFWGTAQTGVWTHFSVEPGRRQWTNRIHSAHSAIAAIHQDYQTICRYLGRTHVADIEEAVRVLESDQLFRSEKVLGAAKWLLMMKQVTQSIQHEKRALNIIWYNVAVAPAGFCHPASSMIGTLISDIESKQFTFQDIRARFAAKMDPLEYQRPQSEPDVGNIQQAEIIIAKLGLEPSLHRRYASLEDIKMDWFPKPAPQNTSDKTGVFGHLKPKSQQEREVLTIPATTMTWTKFSRTVMPHSKEIEYWTDNQARAFGQLTAAVYPDAPPLFQWDDLNQRNAVSLYMHHGGSLPHQFSIVANRWVNVLAITSMPWHWDTTKLRPNMMVGALLCLEGCVDASNDGGTALFPETLIGDLHPIRKTIEAYSRKAKFEGIEESKKNGTAAGPTLTAEGSSYMYRLRVTTDAAGTREYIIDRWD